MNNRVLLLIIGALILVFVAGILILNNKSANQVTQKLTQINSNQQPTIVAKKEVIIDVTEKGFSPETITIKAGTRVVWINRTKGTVTVNSDKHPTNLLYPPLNLGEFGKGSSVQLVFDKPGKFTYHNYLIPSQTGTVIVVK